MCCLKNIWVWLAIIAGVIATFLITGTANAGVSIVSQTPVYNEVKNYETVEVCTPGTKGNPLGGALLGGIIGNNTGDGDAAAGAIIGGILGGLAETPASCHTERRVSGTSKVYSHTRYVIELNGVQHVINQ